MRFRSAAIAVVVAGLALRGMAAADPLTLGGIALPNYDAHTILVDYSGSLPADSEYKSGSNWHVQWKLTNDGPVTTVPVESVRVDAEKHFVLKLSAAAKLPTVENRRAMWIVILTAPDIAFQEAAPYTPAFPLPPQTTTASGNPAPASSKKSCANTYPNAPILCPPQPTDTADMSFTGGFTAAGGSKPLYQFEVKGGYIFHVSDSWRLKPAINTQVEINQNANPPVSRTRFDPDSITAGLAFLAFSNFDTAHPLTQNTAKAKVERMRDGPLVTGLRYQFQAPAFEFNRSDPSGNILGSFVTAIDFKAWLAKPKTDPQTGASVYQPFYATFYPFLGMEAGRNLYRPKMVETIPVDLSGYRGIVRGYAGADAKFGIISGDRTADVFSITGTYRVRIPAMDEPFLETLHNVTSFDMTTKARHWIESDIAYSPQGWKYFSLTATYQYGVLPPFFELVDHKFTFGIRLQAMQGNKPSEYSLIQ